MSLLQTVSAALLASTSLLLATPALAVVPGSGHNADRRDETERHRVANGAASAGRAATRRPVPDTVPGTATTFGYSAGARRSEAAPFASDLGLNGPGGAKSRQPRSR